MNQSNEAAQRAAAERELLDIDGENLAVRSFLMQYSCDRSITVGAMLAHMNRSGWRGFAPAFALEVRPETHLTKAGAQIWIRHLISLEPAALKAQPAPTEAAHGELRAAASAVVARWDTPMWKHETHTAELIDRLRKALHAGAGPVLKTAETRMNSGSPAGAGIAAQGEDSARVEWLDKNCTWAGDSERYLPRRIYWGIGARKSIREAIDKARAAPQPQEKEAGS